MPTQEERSAATRSAIVAAATRLIARDGYEVTTIDGIASAAGVSKGALYHHFPNKRAILLAAYEALEEALVLRLSADTSPSAGPAEALRAGCHAFLAACDDPVFNRIALVEAPVVLGWREWREVDARFGFGLLRAGVQAAVEAGEFPPVDVDALAHLLLSAVLEAASLLGQADRRADGAGDIAGALDALIDGLVRSPT